MTRQMGAFERFRNLTLFIRHVGNPATLRDLRAGKGEHFALFGGTAHTSFEDVKDLMAKEHEKVDWFSGPMSDRADYFSKNYMPFLLAGANHQMRRSHIMGRVAVAHRKLDDLEALLAATPDPDRALARFLFRHLGGIEVDEAEIDRLMYYRKWAAPLALLPKWLRLTAFRSQHNTLLDHHHHFLGRFEAAGQPIGDTWFDVIWFNAATLAFYPQKALDALKASPALLAAITPEAGKGPTERPKTRALIFEMLRLHSRIASTNYVDERGDVQIAVIVTATVDPRRYDRPEQIDLDRDFSDVISFSQSAPNRSCPAHALAPDMMACVVAHAVRTGRAGA